MRRTLRNATAAVAAALLALTASPALAADCKQAIAKGAAQFAQTMMKAMQKCEDGVVKSGGIGSCPDASAAFAIGKAENQLRATIDKKCGGTDRSCGTPGDDLLGDIGWGAGTCPNFENGSCSNSIVDCDDISECLVCVLQAAVLQSVSLSYDALIPSGDSDITRCQRTIGKATARFFGKKAKALQKCEDAVLEGTVAGPCPDAKAAFLIARAQEKQAEQICKDCGGSDRICGGFGSDISPGTIGFAANCPPVIVPGGNSCSQPVSDLEALAECVGCVTEFKVDCLDALGAPTLKVYPAECNGAPAPPTPTQTPIPTATPTPTLTPTVVNTSSILLDHTMNQRLAITDGSQTGLDLTGESCTFEAWVKPSSSPSGSYVLVSKGDTQGSNNAYIFYYRNVSGTLKLSFQINVNSLSQSASVNVDLGTNTWHHVAMTYNAAVGETFFYVDGSQVGVVQATITQLIADSSGAFLIGGAIDGGMITSTFDGRVDDVRVWNAVRSGAQIASARCQELTGSELNLRGYWQLDGDLNDSSPNGNHLSQGGGAQFSSDPAFPPCN